MFDAIEFLKFIVPSIIVGGIAIYYLRAFFEEETRKRKHELKVATTKQSLPIRFQAYERLTLLLERISLVSLARRTPTNNPNTMVYKMALISQVNNEFDHNISQQIYVTPELWKIIQTAKNATILAISHTHDNLKEDQGVNEFQKILLSGENNEDNPTKLALEMLKKEIALEF